MDPFSRTVFTAEGGPSIAGSSISPYSSRVLDRPVYVEILRELSRKISWEWRVIGRNLGLHEVELDGIRLNYDAEGQREIVYMMLIAWQRRMGKNATYRILREALIRAERADLADHIYQLSSSEFDEEMVRFTETIKDRPEQRSMSSLELSSLNRKIQKKDCEELSKSIGNDWKNVGRSLGFSEMELEHLQANHKRQEEVAMQLFIKWMQKTGDAATYNILVNALIGAGRLDLGHELLKGNAFPDSNDEMVLSTEMTKEKPEYDTFQKYNELQEKVTSLLTQRDCEQLGDYFRLTKEQKEAIQSSESSSKVLLDILEEEGLIHHADVNKLLEALRLLTINDRALHMLQSYERLKDEETSFETFLAGLSAYLTLSIPEKLCDYFIFTHGEKKAVISSKSPGLALTMTLQKNGYINPSDVGRLLSALKELHLVQAAAKVEEYQILAEEKIDFKTPAQTLKEKENLFLKCLKTKIKSWYEGMTPIPWKKSCQWKVSDLFIVCGLTLTNTRMKTESPRTQPLSYTDIFTHQDLRDESRIIVEGDPGSGKTMLAFQLAYDWSIGKLKQVNMVIVLPLKFLRDMTITEAIAKFYLPKDAPLSEDDIQAILNSANEESKTCIVLDGIEEYNHKAKDRESSDVDKVMNGGELSKCTVLLTSRSDFEHGFSQYPKLKLGQFGEEERSLYVDRISPEDKERQQKLKMAIQSSDFLREICSNALLFVFVIHNIEPLLEGDVKDHLERVGPFMQLMMESLLSATKSSQSEKDTQGMDHSDALAEIAFNGLCRGQQILMWQKSFLEKKVPNLKMWIESGILVEEENILMRSGGKEKKDKEEHDDEEMPDSKASNQSKREAEVQLQHGAEKRKQDLTLRGSQSGESHEKMEESPQNTKSLSDPRKVSLLVKFLHKVIQEWFAGKHFSLILKRRILENSHQAFLNRYLCIIKPADLHYILRFTSYLCPFSGHCIMKALHNIYKAKDGSLPEYVSNCIALCFIEFDSSMEDDNIDNAVRQVLRSPVTIRGEDNRLLQRSKVSLLDYASNSKIKIRCLKLVGCLRKVAQEQVTLNNDIVLRCHPTIELAEIYGHQKLDEESYQNLVVFITKCSGIREAILDVSNPPPLIEDKNALSEMKSRNMKVNWRNGHVNEIFNINTSKWMFTFGQQSHTRMDDSKAESGSEDKSDKESESERKQTEEELRQIKERYVAIEAEKHQLLNELQTTAKELEETKSNLRAAKEEVSALQEKLEKTRESLNRRNMSMSGTADQQLSPSEQAEDTTNSEEFGDEHVKRIIGKEGGVLEILGTGVSLEIPPGALVNSQLIEMRIIRQHYLNEPLSFYSNVSVVVELLPSHLRLQKEAILTLPHCMVLKEGMEWKANVYSSNHEAGSQPKWEENTEIQASLKERNCVLWLNSFSLWTYFIDKIFVRGKRIILFAAKRNTSSITSMLLDVGFYVDLPNADERLLKLDTILFEEESVLDEKGALPLVIRLEKIEPDHWSLKDEEEVLQTIPFKEIAKAECKFRIFELEGDPNKPEEGTCTFKVWQNEDESSKLRFHLKDPGSSRSKSSAMVKKDSIEDIEELSKLIGNDWKKVGRKLDFSEGELEHLEATYRRQDEVVLQMLMKWRKEGGKTATYDILENALTKAGRADLGHK